MDLPDDIAAARQQDDPEAEESFTDSDSQADTEALLEAAGESLALAEQHLAQLSFSQQASGLSQLSYAHTASLPSLSLSSGGLFYDPASIFSQFQGLSLQSPHQGPQAGPSSGGAGDAYVSVSVPQMLTSLDKLHALRGQLAEARAAQQHTAALQQAQLPIPGTGPLYSVFQTAGGDVLVPLGASGGAPSTPQSVATSPEQSATSQERSRRKVSEGGGSGAGPSGGGGGEASTQGQQPRRRRSPGTRSSASLYVKNLPPETTELFLYHKFAVYGALSSCKIYSDPVTGKCRGVAFVNFVHRDEALKAMEQLQGSLIKEGHQMHITLQAPRAVRNAQRKRAEALQRQQQQLLQQTYEQQQQQRLLGQLPPTAQLPGYQPAQLPPQLQQLQQLGGQAGPSRIMQNLDPTGQLTLQLQLPIGQLGTGQLQGTGQLPGAGQQPGLPPYFM